MTNSRWKGWLLFAGLPALVAVLGIFLWGDGHLWHRQPKLLELAQNLVAEVDEPFDQEKLFELANFGSPALADGYHADALILIYFSNLSCSTCVNRELALLNEMYEAHSRSIDFLLVVNGHHKGYLHSLRRVAQVKYPILIEEEAGFLGFSEKLTLMLVDKRTGRQVFRYHPFPDPRLAGAFDLFRDRVLDYLSIASTDQAAD